MDWLEDKTYFKKILTIENNYTSLIPNLSTKPNTKLYDMFLLGDLKADELLSKINKKSITKLVAELELEKELKKELEKKLEKDVMNLFMPMAVLTSRLNPRIRTQCGCFVAYNLYTLPELPDEIPDKDKEDGNYSLFDYISLESIQEKKINDTIFMYQIEIDKKCCKSVVDWLITLGISRENIYPELSEKGYYFN